jgi:hypothetical protein
MIPTMNAPIIPPPTRTPRITIKTIPRIKNGIKATKRGPITKKSITQMIKLINPIMLSMTSLRKYINISL